MPSMFGETLKAGVGSTVSGGCGGRMVGERLNTTSASCGRTSYPLTAARRPSERTCASGRRLACLRERLGIGIC